MWYNGVANLQKERDTMDTVTELICRLLGPTAWEMEIPRTYGLFHICVMVIGFSLCFLGAWKLRRLDDKKNNGLLLEYLGPSDQNVLFRAGTLLHHRIQADLGASGLVCLYPSLHRLCLPGGLPCPPGLSADPQKAGPCPVSLAAAFFTGAAVFDIAIPFPMVYDRVGYKEIQIFQDVI